MTMVSESSFLALYNAFVTVEACNGTLNRDRPRAVGYDVPDGDLLDVAAIDAALSALTPDELLTFCDGEESDVEAIALRSQALKQGLDLVVAFFERGSRAWRVEPVAA